MVVKQAVKLYICSQFFSRRPSRRVLCSTGQGFVKITCEITHLGLILAVVLCCYLTLVLSLDFPQSQLPPLSVTAESILVN